MGRTTRNSMPLVVATTVGGVLILGLAGLIVYSLPLGVAVLAILAATSCIVFGFSVFMVIKLWSIVIDALGDAKSPGARALLRLVGGIDFEGKRPDGSYYRLTGVGLLGTLLVFVATIAIIYLLSTGDVIRVIDAASDGIVVKEGD